MGESSNQVDPNHDPNLGYFTVKETSTIIQETPNVIRNWLKEFKEYIPLKKNKSGYNVFDDEALEIIKLIKQLSRDQNYTIHQIKHYFATGGESFKPTPKKQTDEILADEMRAMREEIQELRKSNERLEESNKKQDEFNQSLIEALKRQQDHIDNRLDQRDQMLMQSLKESQETRKQIATTEEEKKKGGFWSRLFGKNENY